MFTSGGNAMFQKKQYIYSETQGACIVDNIVQLPAGKGETVPYYVLKSVFDATKVSYIPVRNHQVVLRELFTREEALKMQQDPELKKDDKRKAAVDFVLPRESE
jgi:RNA polymerase-interacting CarD/CdnL/TRCF family regulator